MLTSQGALDRPDWLTRHLGQVPPLILHIREQALPSMQASSEPRVSGSVEQTTAPMHIEPLDDADELWAMVCALAVDFSERSKVEMPDEIDQQRLVVGSAIRVTGFASSDPERIYSHAVTITRYLIAHAWTLAINPEYRIPVDELVEAIAAARRRYPNAPTFGSHRHRCPRCLLHGVVPSYSKSGEIEELRCERCGARRRFTEGRS